MKKTLIGSLVGAVLLFGWQASSHVLMHHHDSAYKQAPGQENVIQTLSAVFKEDGNILFRGVTLTRRRKKWPSTMKE